MKITPLDLPEVLHIEPNVHGDERGFFVETFQRARYAEAGVAQGLHFVQDNLSRSGRGILRGLHLQHPHAQGKLVSCVEGAVFDVAVDVRVGSPTFGRWTGARLDAIAHHQLWVPPGFAHGYQVLSETATFAYKCTELYHPQAELSVAWNDPKLAIAWPLADPILSAKDRAAATLASIDVARLPAYEGR